jgi:hypothetical protein
MPGGAAVRVELVETIEQSHIGNFGGKCVCDLKVRILCAFGTAEFESHAPASPCDVASRITNKSNCRNAQIDEN